MTHAQGNGQRQPVQSNSVKYECYFKYAGLGVAQGGELIAGGLLAELLPVGLYL